MFRFRQVALAASLAFASTFAQTFTSCNPLNSTCPPDIALGQYTEFDFTQTQANPTIWNSTSTPLGFGNSGAEFTIVKSGDSPTIKTNFYFFFGSVSVVMKASPGTGICSSIVLMSDDLDEVDWEFLGGNRTMVQSNYFGKGNTTTYDRAIYHTLSFAPQDDFHNYTTTWSKDKLEWIIDGNVVRTLPYSEANGGKNFPQSPVQLYLGSWAAGDKRNNKNTIEWAQGETTYDKSPYQMFVKNVYVQDASTGSKYVYGDKTGSWESIQIESGTSPLAPEFNKKIGVKAHWNAMSQTTQVVIIACSIAGFLALVGMVIYCCVSSTKKGLREHAKAEADWEAQQKESEHYRALLQQERRATSFGSGATRSMRSYNDTK